MKPYLLLTALGAVVVACSGGGGGDWRFDASVDGAGMSSQAACARYLACVFAAAPAQATGAQAAYGTDGACWKTEPADVCNAGCTMGLDSLHALYPMVAACGQCTGRGDCSAPTPACDTTSHSCVECGASADCSAPKPACEATSHTCVQCTSASDCPDTTYTCDANHCTPCNKPMSCGACGRFCTDVIFNTFDVGTVMGAQCTASKCDGSMDFACNDRRACNDLCKPWNCVDGDGEAWYGTCSTPDHIVSGRPCNEVALASDRGTAFVSMTCHCVEP